MRKRVEYKSNRLAYQIDKRNSCVNLDLPASERSFHDHVLILKPTMNAMRKNILMLLAMVTLLFACQDAEEPTVSDSDNQTNQQSQGNQKAQLAAALTPTMNNPEVILLDGFGYNTRFPDVFDPWNNNAGELWRQGLVNSAGNCIRYPGGTVANYWDAKTNRLFSKKNSANPDGWVDVARIGAFDMVKDVIVNNLQQENSLIDLKRAVDEGKTPVFVLNLLTPGKDFYESPQGWNRSVNGTVGSADWYAMLDDRYNRSKQILIKANNQGIPVKFIELGNEYYIANCPYNEEAFPTGGAYATAANYIANKIANDPDLNFLSNYRLSVPGAAEEMGNMESARIVNWNGQMVPNLNRNLISAISLHTYQNPATAPTTFTDVNIREYVSSWLSKMQETTNQKQTTQQIFNNNWRSWWTEVSVGRPENNSNYSKWGHALVQVYSLIWTFEQGGQLTMFGNLNSTRVVDRNTGALRSTGWAFKPLMLASKSKLRACKMNLFEFETDRKLKGIVFHDDDANSSNRRVCIINLTNAPITVDLSNVFPVATNLILYGVKQTDLNSTANPTEIPNRSEPTANLTLDAYSVNFVRP